jgi:5-formyltetrahydrofolate cyclo-ligase
LIETKSSYPKPAGIVWEEVSEEDMETMPVLKEIKELISNK